MIDRFSKSVLILLASCGMTLIAYSMRDAPRLIYLAFPLVIVIEVSLTLLTFVQESVPPTSISRLKAAGWVHDEEDPGDSKKRPVWWIRGEDEILYGEFLNKGDFRVLTFNEGSLHYQNEFITQEVLDHILAPHTHTPTPPEDPVSPHTHTPTPKSPQEPVTQPEPVHAPTQPMNEQRVRTERKERERENTNENKTEIESLKRQIETETDPEKLTSLKKRLWRLS